MVSDFSAWSDCYCSSSCLHFTLNVITAGVVASVDDNLVETLRHFTDGHLQNFLSRINIYLRFEIWPHYIIATTCFTLKNYFALNFIKEPTVPSPPPIKLLSKHLNSFCLLNFRGVMVRPT